MLSLQESVITTQLIAHIEIEDFERKALEYERLANEERLKAKEARKVLKQLTRVDIFSTEKAITLCGPSFSFADLSATLDRPLVPAEKQIARKALSQLVVDGVLVKSGSGRKTTYQKIDGEPEIIGDDPIENDPPPESSLSETDQKDGSKQDEKPTELLEDELVELANDEEKGESGQDWQKQHKKRR